jgi:uncharacterized protein YndB with AHSA1/START domain
MFLVIILLIPVVFLGIVATRPNNFRIHRDLTVNATPEAVFEQINSFKAWEAWSPWAKMDPTMQITYSGPESGVDSHYAWSGNGKVGSGKMTITESQPHDKIVIRLEFLKPVPATNITTFSITPQGSKTLVGWTMTGKNGFAGKLFDLIMNMDKTIGKDFEKGLAGIQSVVEK